MQEEVANWASARHSEWSHDRGARVVPSSWRDRRSNGSMFLAPYTLREDAEAAPVEIAKVLFRRFRSRPVGSRR